MKKINYALAILACALLALSATSCKDNKNEESIQEPIANQYTFDGTTYPILSAGISDYGGGNFWFVFSRFAITDNFEVAPESYIHFTINEEDFGAATSVFRNFAFIDNHLDILYINTKSGTVKVVKDGDNYTLDFEMTIDDEGGTEYRLTGHYSGAPEVVLR